MRAEDLEGEVSQRRQLEQELRELRRAHARLESRLRDSSADLDMANEQAAQLAAIVESSDDAIVGTTLGGIVTIWNRGAEQLFGYSAEEIIGQPTATHMRLNWPDELKAMKRVRNGEHVPPFEAIRTRKDSKEIHVSVRISPIRDGQGRVTGASAIFRDITERKNLEERARQSQKMEAIGQLAGGVAHDFNNLLTVISGYTEMLLTSADADDPARELLEEVRKAGEQAATLTRQLLAFSRKQVLEERVLDLNAIIGDTQTMLRRLIGEDVGLTTALASELDRIRADAGQIQQVILNLAVNARDAMPQGGELVIGTANVELSEAEAQELGELAPGRYVLLAVTDTGCGMPPEVQARLFEPFFTTKGHGKGTGLGLATVYGIVRQSGGAIQVRSELGRGTTFRIYLPRVKEKAPAAKAHDAGARPGGTETILLVEDEREVRVFTRCALEALGYTILEAEDGADALRLFRQHAGAIQLLVTDVVMPVLGGRQMAERLTAWRPGLRVLYLSGYPDDAVVRNGIRQAEADFLQKPFTLSALATKVREVLDG